jgi:hypothetical protein
VQKLGGSIFKIGERLILLRGNLTPQYPAAVNAIPINARFDAFYVLHATMFGSGFGVNDGTEIGTYVVHYADQTAERIPVLYGRDMRDWWHDSDQGEPSRAALAWGGKNDANSAEGAIRLFASEWQNPHPEKRVASIDFESKDTACAPFLVAMTVERTLYQESDDR